MSLKCNTRSFGLVGQYRQDDNMKKLVHRASVLLQVPTNQVWDFKLHVLENNNDFEFNEPMSSFTEYVTEAWVEGSSLSTWNHCFFWRPENNKQRRRLVQWNEYNMSPCTSKYITCTYSLDVKRHTSYRWSQYNNKALQEENSVKWKQRVGSSRTDYSSKKTWGYHCIGLRRFCFLFIPLGLNKFCFLFIPLGLNKFCFLFITLGVNKFCFLFITLELNKLCFLFITLELNKLCFLFITLELNKLCFLFITLWLNKLCFLILTLELNKLCFLFITLELNKFCFLFITLRLNKFCFLFIILGVNTFCFLFIILQKCKTGSCWVTFEYCF